MPPMLVWSCGKNRQQPPTQSSSGHAERDAWPAALFRTSEKYGDKVFATQWSACPSLYHVS